MLRTIRWWIILALLIPGLLGGCVRAARDTTGFASEQKLTVEIPFEEAWQGVKATLQEQELELYTRDKRGTFVAFTKQRKRIVPQRVKYTILMDAVSDNETTIHVEAIQQAYGVTMLTYPDWHDRKAKGDNGAEELVNALRVKLAEAPASN